MTHMLAIASQYDTAGWRSAGRVDQEALRKHEHVVMKALLWALYLPDYPDHDG